MNANDIVGGGMFNEAPGFVFNMGGGPGIRVHQFGGRAPRRRPRDPNAPADPPPALGDILKGLLPLLLVLFLPLLSTLFSSSGSSGPSMRFETPEPGYTMERNTKELKIPYYLIPKEVDGYTARQFTHLDQQADSKYVSKLNLYCQQEVDTKHRIYQEAQGFFFNDEAMIQKAKHMEMPNCNKLESLGLRRSSV